MNPTLSYDIAIPTYNRGTALVRLLDDIHSAFPIHITIFIRDNCSTDQTLQLLSVWIASHTGRKVIVSQNRENIGIDRNILEVINDCHADWVKLFGDDDSFSPDLIPAIDGFASSEVAGRSALAFFNYCEVTPDFQHRRTDRQVALYQDRVYQDGREIICDVAEMIPLISGLLVKRAPFLNSAAGIPGKIATSGVGFVWAMLDMLNSFSSVFYSEPLIFWANGEPERGFSWKRTVVSDFLWIVSDRCPQYLRRVKIRTIHNQITPRLRLLARSRASLSERIALLSFLLGYYWNIPHFWLSSFPRALTPSWAYSMFHKISRS